MRLLWLACAGRFAQSVGQTREVRFLGHFFGLENPKIRKVTGRPAKIKFLPDFKPPGSQPCSFCVFYGSLEQVIPPRLGLKTPEYAAGVAFVALDRGNLALGADSEPPGYSQRASPCPRLAPCGFRRLDSGAGELQARDSGDFPTPTADPSISRT